MRVANENKVGGFMIEGNKEFLIRILASTRHAKELKKTLIKTVSIFGPVGMNFSLS